MCSARNDGGKNWEALPGMHGKSIRAMAIWRLPIPTSSSPARLMAFIRSKDGGNNWERISSLSRPKSRTSNRSRSIPRIPNVVYAGTWHLAWKTPDGGANWQHINKGMIDDSDVFSVIVDSTNPSIVFASACSGIYKSENCRRVVPASCRGFRSRRAAPAC